MARTRGTDGEGAPEKVPAQDDEVAEEWIRRTSETDVRGIGATKWRGSSEWPWRVTVSAAEFVREDPLERVMRDAIDAALRGVPGVRNVAEEDREVWLVAGDPTGDALVRAAGEAIDRLQADIREHLKSLEE
jgi:hypothetical protein